VDIEQHGVRVTEQSPPAGRAPRVHAGVLRCDCHRPSVDLWAWRIQTGQVQDRIESGEVAEAGGESAELHGVFRPGMAPDHRIGGFTDLVSHRYQVEPVIADLEPYDVV